jgi:hypothetical protein
MTTITIIDSAAHPRAAEYFGTFLSEPVLPEGFLQIDRNKIFKIPRMSLFDLLSTIVRNGQARSNILTVSHGTGGGLLIPLIPAKQGSRQVLGLTEVELLLKYVAGTIDEEGFASSVDWGDAKKELEEVKQALPVLRDLILKVRSIKLDKWVMRSCEIGGHLDSLQKLRLLLGATTACAPKHFDFYSFMRPKLLSGSSEFDKFVKDHSAKISGEPPNRLAWILSFNYKIEETVAESSKAPAEFVAKHFPKISYSGNRPFPVHAIALAEDLVFPMDPPFRGQLARVGT